MATPWIPADSVAMPVIPYLTPGEYRAAGTAVDTTQLVVGGNATQQTAALANRIMQASSFADQLCFQILGATTDVETSQDVYVRNDGTIRVPVKYWPILEVDSVSVGLSPTSMVTLPDLSGLWQQGRRVLSIPVVGLAAAFSTSMVSSAGRVTAGSRVFVKVTYVNGWPCTTLAATAAAAATTLQLASTVGFYAGRTYRIHDVAGGPEQFTVLAVTDATHLSLTAPLAITHTKPSAPDGITVSGLPDAVRAAVVELVSMLIRTRGDSAIVMAAVAGEPAHEGGAEPGAILNLDTALMLLSEFKRAAR